MVQINISNDDFRLFKQIPSTVRIIGSFLLLLGGIAIQIFLPINGIYPFEMKSIAYIPFFIGLILLVLALILAFPERLIISEEPKLTDDPPVWEETTMSQLSNFFNIINKRSKKEKSLASSFDLSSSKGKWVFIGSFLGITVIYLLVLGLINKLYLSTTLFLLDIYLFLIPLWFIIRIESWDPEILRKILFFYQFQKDENLDEFEFTTSAAVQLKKMDTGNDEVIMVPVNVRFMTEFDDAPKSFDSLSIQITINKYMGNNFPFMVAFLRFKKPNDWMPLKKDEATADRIVKIKHELEEDGLHLFVLSKSPKVENPNHTSPRDATKIFRRAYKMMRDFG